MKKLLGYVAVMGFPAVSATCFSISAKIRESQK